MDKLCVACKMPTPLFSNGVASCTSCTSFFRRTQTCTKPLGKCKGNCNPKCRLCRFKSCLDGGMICKVSYKKFDDVAYVIDSIGCLNHNRQNLFLNYIPTLDFSLDDCVLNEPIKFRKLENKFGFLEWSCAAKMTSVNFLKHLEFVGRLSTMDHRNFIRSTIYLLVVYFNVMSAFDDGKSVVSYPDGTDVYPIGVREAVGEDHVILRRSKSQLICRLQDLKVTKEEMNLIGVIAVCNPIISNFTESGRMEIEKYQKVCSSTLLQYCQITYQSNGPSRFSELLSICQLIYQTWEDVKKIAIICQTDPSKRRIKFSKEFMELIFE